jgi:hypothetical protein
LQAQPAVDHHDIPAFVENVNHFISSSTDLEFFKDVDFEPVSANEQGRTNDTRSMFEPQERLSCGLNVVSLYRLAKNSARAMGG